MQHNAYCSDISYLRSEVYGEAPQFEQHGGPHGPQRRSARAEGRGWWSFFPRVSNDGGLGRGSGVCECVTNGPQHSCTENRTKKREGRRVFFMPLARYPQHPFTARHCTTQTPPLHCTALHYTTLRTQIVHLL